MRNVIVLDPTLKMDEVDVSYKSFIVSFSGRIAKRIMRDKGWSMTKTYNYIKSKFKFDPYIRSIMDVIIEEEQPELIINRNPKNCGVVKSL